MVREGYCHHLSTRSRKAIADPDERNIREDEVVLEEFKLVVFHRSHTSPLPRLRKHLA